ncbi:hypothetical protein K7X08_026021 [Anisodus acutangulus]|uniref:SET domain-containing protein n=1 Tax=Anisodus acutangulus TaxID=402998 RepID=A0A9Q1N691_9SOLA|nr:hypothetical protein K7X08_026021 [Anisodus acutangulus]
MANSLTYARPLTCTAATSTLYPTRLVPQPPDLIKWVKNEGSDIIALPHHIPLQFGSDNSHDGGSHSALVKLAQHVPGVNWKLGAFGRGAVGYEIGFEASARESKERFVLVAIHQQSPGDLYNANFLSWRGYKELAVCPPLLYQVNKRCRFLLEFEKLLKHELKNVKPDDHTFGGQDVDSSALGWAMSAVSSRVFRLYGSKRPDVTEIVQEEKNGNSNILVKVVAVREIKQNDPLLLNYGCLSSDLFLLDYGVSPPNFSSSSPWQQQILLHLNLEGQNADLKVTLGGGELVESRLLAALRVILSK